MEQLLPLLHSHRKIHLTGAFGTGKSTLALERIRWLLRQERTRGDDLLVLVPQKTLAQPYFDALRGPDAPPGPPVRVMTAAALARSALELYWPLVATQSDFDDPSREPTFLNLETSQYHMASFVDLAIGRAEFDGIRIERSRIISQVLDNMNKAALQGFSIDDAYRRLELAVPSGEQRTARLNALNAARTISNQFRQLCLQETLIDFSLQTELFNKQILQNEWSRTHLFRNHRHLFIDNPEEDNLTTHRLIAQWAPQADSLLVLSDSDAGYRLFLGADPEGVDSLSALCEETIVLHQSHIMRPALTNLTSRIEQLFSGRREVVDIEPPDEELWDTDAPPEGATYAEIPEDTMGPSLPLKESNWAEQGRAELPIEASEENDASEAENDLPLQESLYIPDTAFRFYPQMIDWVVDEVQRLIHSEGVLPEQIVLLAPFVSDALRFSLQTGLAKYAIELTTHRPSRALQNEPATQALIALAKLAHPDWGIRPAFTDMTLALTMAIQQLDPVRANLLGQIVYPPRGRNLELGRFGGLVPAMQQRISFVIGERYDQLREWIYAYRASAELLPLDQFFARLFGELLSQPGFGFHNDNDAARIANQLVESSRNFRWSLQSHDAQHTMMRVGQEYILLLESGALGALYAPGWQETENAVFLAPAYTFMMRNRAVDIQFWMDIGSGGWWERLYQPLTHPYVLSHRWPANQPWSDFDEFKTRQETMRRLLLGLVRRTRQRVYLGLSDYSESGFEQRGPLLGVINRLLAQR
ncbi:MAG: hypothetical protein AAF702_33155 [Chloroflexota bacterium]